MKVNTTINGMKRILDVKPDEYLLDTLRRHNYLSVRRGCDTTSCGVCTILIDDKPVPSCAFLSVRAEGKRITTVEGIPKEAEKLSEHFGATGADQCGFCNPGIALSVYALKKSQKKVTAETLKHYLTGHLCRCTGYQSQHKAIKEYLGDSNE